MHSDQGVHSVDSVEQCRFPQTRHDPPSPLLYIKLASFVCEMLFVPNVYIQHTILMRMYVIRTCND